MDTRNLSGVGEYEDTPEKPGHSADFDGLLVLPENLANALCGELHESISKCLGSGDKLCVDAGNVEQIGTACVQLLLSAARSADDMNTVFQLTNTSEPFMLAFRDLGLEEHLAGWITAQ